MARPGPSAGGREREDRMGHVTLSIARMGQEKADDLIGHNYRLKDVPGALGGGEGGRIEVISGEAGAVRARLAGQGRRFFSVIMEASGDRFLGRFPGARPGRREEEAGDDPVGAFRDFSLAWAREVFGQGLISEVMHLDESAPHLHLVVSEEGFREGTGGSPLFRGPRSLKGYRRSYYAHMARLGLERADFLCQWARKALGRRKDFYVMANEALGTGLPLSFPCPRPAAVGNGGLPGRLGFWLRSRARPGAALETVERGLAPLARSIQLYAHLLGRLREAGLGLDRNRDEDHPAAGATHPLFLLGSLLGPGAVPGADGRWRA
ncbi:MAG: plasmid recombination protein, partial [Deltaproteobacteria bacterium]|nr:plasmid recombination protein [Deltaproteobacteria bacterium]